MKDYHIFIKDASRRDWEQFENFTETLTGEIVNDLEQGRDPRTMSICFDYSAEGTMWVVDGKWFPHAIHDFCLKYNIPPSNVTYRGTNARMREVYDKWHKMYYPNEEKINLVLTILGLRLYFKTSSWAEHVHYPKTNPADLRTHKFNCLNANMSLPHRMMLLREMYDRNLLDTENNIISFHVDMRHPLVPIPEELFNMCPIQYDVSGNWDEVYNVLLKPVPGAFLDYNKIGNYEHIYNNTYVTVTTESSECFSFGGRISTTNEQLNTYMNQFHREMFLTEKITRPMLYWQPQLVVCTDGTLAYLRSIGFETFGDFWDESYDNEPDGEKRVSMVTDIIEEINSMPIRELHSMYNKMLPILEHNRNHLINFDFKDTAL